MKKVLLGVSVLLNVVIVSASFTAKPGRELMNVNSGDGIPCGYRIIEFGKGIDCHGDTVKLIRRDGIQVRVD